MTGHGQNGEEEQKRGCTQTILIDPFVISQDMSIEHKSDISL